MQLVDTHCHIHSLDYPLDVTEVEQRALEAGVAGLICVGTDASDSRRAVQFVQDRPHAWASVGLHPHDAKEGEAALQVLRDLVEEEDSATPRARELPVAVRVFPAWLIKKLVFCELDDASLQFSSPSSSAKAEVRWGTPTTVPLEASLLYKLSLTSKPSGTSSTEGCSAISDLSVAKPRVTSGGAAPKILLSLIKNFRGGPDGRTHGVFKSPSTKPSGKRTLLQEMPERPEGIKEKRKIIAIGECGLDYFYNNSPKKAQEKALRYQIELALEYDLPLIFHIRDAFDDFWPIFDSYKNLRGVVHSFTDTRQNLDKLLSRNLLVGVNGIMTFTKNDWQLAVARAIPLQNLLLETDAPFLTPAPYRGRVNEPARVRVTAEFLAGLRGESLEALAQATTQNARQLFSI